MFYLAWFFQLYEATEQGWKLVRTPDGLPIGRQDAHFHRALETIARTMNMMLSEERRREAQKGKTGGKR